MAGGDSLVARHGVVGLGTDMWPDARPASSQAVTRVTAWHRRRPARCGPSRGRAVPAGGPTRRSRTTAVASGSGELLDAPRRLQDRLSGWRATIAYTDVRRRRRGPSTVGSVGEGRPSSSPASRTAAASVVTWRSRAAATPQSVRGVALRRQAPPHARQVENVESPGRCWTEPTRRPSEPQPGDGSEGTVARGTRRTPERRGPTRRIRIQSSGRGAIDAVRVPLRCQLLVRSVSVPYVHAAIGLARARRRHPQVGHHPTGLGSTGPGSRPSRAGRSPAHPARPVGATRGATDGVACVPGSAAATAGPADDR